MIHVYQPSSGTEGEWFMESFCYHCKKERWIHHQEDGREEDKCKLLSNSMLYDVKDPEYPIQWQFDDVIKKVTCIAYEEWDWKLGDPPPVVIPDPNQLNLFGE